MSGKTFISRQQKHRLFDWQFADNPWTMVSVAPAPGLKRFFA
jgi:hypothetical protein